MKSHRDMLLLTVLIGVMVAQQAVASGYWGGWRSVALTDVSGAVWTARRVARGMAREQLRRAPAIWELLSRVTAARVALFVERAVSAVLPPGPLIPMVCAIPPPVRLR